MPSLYSCFIYLLCLYALNNNNTTDQIMFDVWFLIIVWERLKKFLIQCAVKSANMTITTNTGQIVLNVR